MKKIVVTVLLAMAIGFAQDVILNESFEGSTFPPTDWSVTSGSQWFRTSSVHGGLSAPAGSYVASNDWPGVHAGGDTLFSPILDFSAYDVVNYTLWINFHYWSGSSHDEFQLLISTDGGSTWDIIDNWDMTDHPGGYETYDISSWAAGESNVMLGYNYWLGSTGDGWYVDIDSVLVTADTSSGGGGQEGYDILMYRITDPSGDQVEPNKPIEPGCVVKNDDESADPTPDHVVVKCRINESGGSQVYSEGKTIGSLEPGEKKPVHFPAWTPRPGKVYVMTFYIDNTTVPGDEDITNNKKVKDVYCPAGQDVGTIAIIFPTKETTEITEYPTPIGVFENFSTDTASFEVHCMVYSSSDPSKVYYDKKVDISALAPNVEDTVEFEQWVPTEAVDDDVVFTYYTVWAEDENPDNDTLTSDAVHANLGAGIVEYKVEEGYGITPNPSNGNTEIYYSVDHSSNVVIRLYDLTGSEVARLFSGKVSSGRHSITLDVSDMNPGIYFVRYELGSSVYLKKLIITK